MLDWDGNIWVYVELPGGREWKGHRDFEDVSIEAKLSAPLLKNYRKHVDFCRLITPESKFISLKVLLKKIH
jgi:hypothetical protein